MLTRSCAKCLTQIPMDNILYGSSKKCPYCRIVLFFSECICYKCTGMYEAQHIEEEHSSVSLVE